jgi:hypothetical protein
VPGVFLLIPLAVGLALTVAVSQIGRAVQVAHSRTALLAGRIAVSVVAVALLPGTITDLRDVIVRDDTAAVSTQSERG